LRRIVSRILRLSSRISVITIVTFLGCASVVTAQSPLPYGSPVTLETAHKAATAALAEARKNSWTVAVAIVDAGGNLVYFEKIDGTQTGSVNVSIAKARSAALYKRPTKAFQDTLASGGVGLRVVHLEGAVAVEGGIPIIVDQKVVGAIGVSGATAEQDGQCASAGVAVVK
jgi:uncharacterized protein GlcG (DUF336 family)